MNLEILLLAWFIIPSSLSKPIQVQKGDLIKVSSGEKIYVRKAGHGPTNVILVPGNNCSGKCFEPILSFVRGIDKYDDNYTFYAFDYRGSGNSTYKSKINSLRDFAQDFNDIIQRDRRLRKGDIILVGDPMGFGVAQEMVILDSSKYSSIISLAGIGTRGIRVIFDSSSAGTNPVTGKTYSKGDWSDSLSATAFQQRGWQGANRTYDNLVSVWDMVVFNDLLKYDISKLTPTDTSFKSNPFYKEILTDIFTIEYMPESLHYCHFFNKSKVDLTHTNHNGDVITIPGSNELGAFNGKKVLLVKAETDYAAWRGDLIINNSIFQNTKYDLCEAGALVTSVLINPDQGYDHGFPITHPLETLQIIDKFVKTPYKMTTTVLDPIIGKGNYTISSSCETFWERRT